MLLSEEDKESMFKLNFGKDARKKLTCRSSEYRTSPFKKCINEDDSRSKHIGKLRRSMRRIELSMSRICPRRRENE
jgi:hypothetical protein